MWRWSGWSRHGWSCRGLHHAGRPESTIRTQVNGQICRRDLAEEFERRGTLLEQAGDIPDPRDARITRITRLKTENSKLKDRLSRRELAIEELTAFRTTAVSRLAAQHDEIQRLRRSAGPSPDPQVRRLPLPVCGPVIGPC
jgi:hypothetical protein